MEFKPYWCELIKTDMPVKIPKHTYGRILPGSVLALKHLINVGGGVIDSEYRGNIGVILFNHSPKNFKVEIGDRIAQLIPEKIKVVYLFQLMNCHQKNDALMVLFRLDKFNDLTTFLSRSNEVLFLQLFI